jgi:hypothetical protein
MADRNSAHAFSFMQDNAEKWASYPDDPDYEISSYGRVLSHKSSRHPRFLAPWIAGPKRHVERGRGMLYVSLCTNGVAYKRAVHRLVLEAFVGLRPLGMECRHLNGKCRDNRLDNLKWGSTDENLADKIQHGNFKPFVAKGNEPILFTDNFVPSASLYANEVWRDIPEHDGYDASNWGRIRSWWKHGRTELGDIPKVMSGTTKRSFDTVKLKQGDRKVFKSRPLAILETFSPKPFPRAECRHANGDLSDHRLSNLCWSHHVENARDKEWRGTQPHGERHPQATTTDAQVEEIRRRRANGERSKDLAAEFNVNINTIGAIVSGKSRRLSKLAEAS